MRGNNHMGFKEWMNLNHPELVKADAERIKAQREQAREFKRKVFQKSILSRWSNENEPAVKFKRKPDRGHTRSAAVAGGYSASVAQPARVRGEVAEKPSENPQQYRPGSCPSESHLVKQHQSEPALHMRGVWTRSGPEPRPTGPSAKNGISSRDCHE